MTAIRSAISAMGFIDSSFCQGKGGVPGPDAPKMQALPKLG